MILSDFKHWWGGSGKNDHGFRFLGNIELYERLLVEEPFQRVDLLLVNVVSGGNATFFPGLGTVFLGNMCVCFMGMCRYYKQEFNRDPN